MSINLGTVKKLKIPCLGNPPGTRGVCFNIHEDTVQLIFENGELDGFSPDEIDEWLDPDFQEEVESLQTYNFISVIRTSDDFNKGIFSPAFFNK